MQHQSPDIRRRSPGWVRDLPDRTVHAMACRFIRDFAGPGLTPAQDRLLTSLLSELEYRRRDHLRRRQILAACSCWLCIPVGEWTTEPE